MSLAGPRLHYMRCVATRTPRSPVRMGTYAPVMSIDGCAPNRNAIITDCWGMQRMVSECETGRWRLAIESGEAVAEFVSV